MTSRVGTISVTTLACACLAGCSSTDRTGTAQAGRPTAATALVGDTAAITQASGPTTPPAQLPLAGRVITVDPGHNGGNFTHPQEIGRLLDDGNGEKECDTTGTAAPDGYRETDFKETFQLRCGAGFGHLSGVFGRLSPC